MHLTDCSCLMAVGIVCVISSSIQKLNLVSYFDHIQLYLECLLLYPSVHLLTLQPLFRTSPDSVQASSLESCLQNSICLQLVS